MPDGTVLLQTGISTSVEVETRAGQQAETVLCKGDGA